VSGFRPRFFAPPDTIAEPGAVLTLDADDSHHVLHVLRLRLGDACEVVVGAAVHAATVLPATGGGGTAVQVRLGERLQGPEAGAPYAREVALVQALARPAAVDWAVEKSTEAGVSLIILVPAAGSPRPGGREPKGKADRWARIAREAAKQSKQPAVPPVELARSIAAALAAAAERGLRSVLLEPGADVTLYELLAPMVSSAPASSLGGDGAGEEGVALWVGPESGWTEEELAALIAAGAAPARLGRGVLRTETAGPVAVAVARLALADW
jgi:16S rRNA (uracil1498-N3)-methyltransferase